MEIRDVGPVIMSFRMQNVPLKNNGYRIVSDEKARAEVRSIINSNLYKRTDGIG